MTIQHPLAFCILRWWWSQRRWDARAQTHVNSAMIVLLHTSVKARSSRGSWRTLTSGTEDISHGDRLPDHTFVVYSDRIGAMGICTGRGYTTNAAINDRRVKAVGTVSAVNIGSMFGNGWVNNIKSADLIPVLEKWFPSKTAGRQDH